MYSVNNDVHLVLFYSMYDDTSHAWRKEKGVNKSICNTDRILVRIDM